MALEVLLREGIFEQGDGIGVAKVLVERHLCSDYDDHYDYSLSSISSVLLLLLLSVTITISFYILPGYCNS